MILVGKHAVLLGEERAAAIDQIDAGQAILFGHLLRAHVLLDGLVKERAALHGRVVGDDHARHAAHHADAGDDAGRRDFAVVLAPGRKGRQLKKRAVVVDQEIDALAREQLAALLVLLDETERSVRAHLGHAGPQVGQQALVVLAVRAELVGIGANTALQDIHTGEDSEPAPRRRETNCSGRSAVHLGNSGGTS